MTEGKFVMDEDELRIGKKRRSSDPAVALAEEAVRIQREVVVELRRKAATRIAKDEAAKKAAEKETPPLPGEQKKDAAAGTERKRETTPPERMVPRNPDTSTKLDIEA